MSSASTSWSSIRSMGLRVPFIPDAELRQVTCRAFNTFSADLFREYQDRLTPAAVIPMHTPAGGDRRTRLRGQNARAQGRDDDEPDPPPDPVEHNRNPRYNEWLDMLGLDSDYDYDPVWAKCVELGVSPSFHSVTEGRRHARLALECGLQPYWSFRRGGRGGLQGAVPWRRDAALPDAQVRLPGRRRGMGLRSLQRSHRPLEEAQSGGARRHQSGQRRSPVIDEAVPRIRRQGRSR